MAYGKKFMLAAISEAKKGFNSGGIPIGSVLVYKNKIIGRGHNQRLQKGSVIKHGEMDALENAGRQPASVYKNAVLYTTLSPCPMCSGAIRLYGIPEIIIGENKTFLGDEKILTQYGVKLQVIQDEECILLMKKFIEQKPEEWNEDIGEEN